MKLYTRSGDDGSTGLFGGQRVDKDALRVAAYGTVDELNAALGIAHAICQFEELRDALTRLQSRLFDVGADLCTIEDEKKKVRIGDRHVQEIEQLIDRVSEQLPPLKTFVLPGGSELAARLHFARTVCRRAERLIVTLSRQEPVNDAVLPYMNRISDLLFAVARRANQLAGHPDIPWQPETNAPD